MRFEVRETTGRERTCEPVQIGLPCAVGVVRDVTEWTLVGPSRDAVPGELVPLARWPDGSVRWLLARLLVSAIPGAVMQYDLEPRLEASHTPPTDVPPSRNFVEGPIASAWRFTAEAEGEWLAMTGEAGTVAGACRLIAYDAANRRHVAEVNETEMLSASDWGSRWRATGQFPGLNPLRFSLELSLFHEGRLAKCVITLSNPSRARHRDGYWDLGDPGSILLRGVSLESAVDMGAEPAVTWRERPAEISRPLRRGGLSIVQESSGGEAWRSRSHVDRTNQVRLRHPGYRAHAAGGLIEGRRACPVVALSGKNGRIAATLTEFWEKFPSGLEVDGETLIAHLLPRDVGYEHELQGGERLTREIWWSVADGDHCPCEQLAWVHDPLAVALDAQSVSESRALLFIPSPRDPARPELRSLLEAALDGPASFFAKREAVDEYDWRNFGDMWADHEQRHYEGPTPVISHYNNQYDLLYGLLIQYLLTGDARWWRLADPLARHVLDIDIYHAEHDKSAYCGGLFWHTAHYHDAGTATHRSMSRLMRGQKIPAPGGGPGNEHNYATGLLLYHFLTGDDRARAAVLGLADWVIAMDDGRQHLLGLVSASPTGFASGTSQAHYHGPGRGAGNSINTMLDAWLASDDDRYLLKAEQLLRRTIHPRDDLSARDLNNSELRWSYTVHLQAVCRFLEIVPAQRVGAILPAYLRASVLHYARWMAEHERCHLDHPEKLEYPTETWAAQDLRKGNVLLMAARLAQGDERGRFQRRGEEILDRAWEQLLAQPTRMFTRPLALALQQGYLETFLRAHVELDATSIPESPCEFGEPVAFVPQKEQSRRLVREPQRIPAALWSLTHVGRWLNIARRSWPAERLRRLTGCDCRQADRGAPVALKTQ